MLQAFPSVSELRVGNKTRTMLLCHCIPEMYPCGHGRAWEAYTLTVGTETDVGSHVAGVNNDPD